MKKGRPFKWRGEARADLAITRDAMFTKLIPESKEKRRSTNCASK